MKLLITTQAVDLDDPVLGFMHRWIEEFAKHYESIEVICLKRGRLNLPVNVHVHSLGKPSFAPPSQNATGGQSKASQGEGIRVISRAKYIFNFYRYLWVLCGSYDAVFVHMNQEYVLLGGIFWRMTGKKVVLWRNHKKGSWTTQIACMIANTVCYTSSAAYIAHFKNAVQMPIGIDTETFIPPQVKLGGRSILFLGRIDAVKKPIEFLEALKILADQGIIFHADIYGDPTYPNDPYFGQFKEAVQPLLESGHVSLFPSVPNEKTPAIYGAHQIYVNLTPSGSFDKTIGEAMSCGCIVVAVNEAVKDIIPPECFVGEGDAISVSESLNIALTIEDHIRVGVVERARTYVVVTHSLSHLIQRLMPILTQQ